MSVRRLGGEWIAYEVHDASYHCRFCDELVKCGEQHSHTFHKEEGARSWDGQFAEPLAGSGGGTRSGTCGTRRSLDLNDHAVRRLRAMVDDTCVASVLTGADPAGRPHRGEAS